MGPTTVPVCHHLWGHHGPPCRRLGGGVTVADQLTVSVKITTWAGAAIRRSTPENGVVSNTTFEKPGEILQFDFSRTNGQSLSNRGDQF